MRSSIHKNRISGATFGGGLVRGAASAAQMAIGAALVVLIAVAAWWFMGSSSQAPVTTAKAPASAPASGTPDATAPAEVQALTTDQLYKAARSAMGENRMVTPAGNNALEYYLQIIAKQPDDAGAKDALRELFPFATGSAEDQVNQGNFDEATRIMNLLAKADPSNYALTILRNKLDAKKKQNDHDQQVAQQAAAAAAAKAQAAAAGTTTPATTAAETAAAAGTPAADAAATAAARAAAPAPKTEVARATPPPTTAPPVAPEAPTGESHDVRVVTPPRPSYPPAAARNRQDGWVEVEFTVGADGSVQNAKVVSSNPARVFDREAVKAIQQAKFEPRMEKGQAVASTLRRRIEFKLGE